MTVIEKTGVSVDCTTDDCICPKHNENPFAGYEAAFAEFLPALTAACDEQYAFGFVLEDGRPQIEMEQAVVVRLGDEWLATSWVLVSAQTYWQPADYDEVTVYEGKNARDAVMTAHEWRYGRPEVG